MVIMKQFFFQLRSAWQILVCLFAFLILATSPIKAQITITGLHIDPNTPISFKHEEPVDTPVVECKYELTLVDTVLSRTVQARVLVQVGTDWAACLPYREYWQDSLLWTTDWRLTWEEYKRKDYLPDDGYYDDRLLRNLTTNRMDVQGLFGGEFCYYADSTARFDWTLEDETMTVCGYTCRKATARFRGRTWTAWYAEELPVNAGPWKLYGLPGLILRAEVADGTLLFEAVQVRRPGAYYIARSFPTREYHEVTREAALSIDYESKVHPNEYNATQGVKILHSSDGDMSFHRGIYVPLELE